jgi:hypothetical protein
MTDTVDNRILEHLKALRNEVRDFRTQALDDLRMIKRRLTSLEGQVASVHADMALIHGRIDRVDLRIDRTERRLEHRDDAS